MEGGISCLSQIFMLRLVIMGVIPADYYEAGSIKTPCSIRQTTSTPMPLA